MSVSYDARPSPLQAAHATVFGVGLVSLLIATFAARPVWFVIGGVCLTVSGGLVLAGCRLTFSGPVGTALRTALGQATVRRLNLRAFVWVVAGILISIWGVERMRSERNAEPFPEEPVAGERAAPSQG